MRMKTSNSLQHTVPVPLFDGLVTLHMIPYRTWLSHHQYDQLVDLLEADKTIAQTEMLSENGAKIESPIDHMGRIYGVCLYTLEVSTTAIDFGDIDHAELKALQSYWELRQPGDYANNWELMKQLLGMDMMRAITDGYFASRQTLPIPSEIIRNGMPDATEDPEVISDGSSKSKQK